MPRRRRAFIDRSRARTFQLVHGSEGAAQVLVPASEAENGEQSIDGNQNSIDVSRVEGIAVGPLHEAYIPRDYELGEFGFPDDEYDYSQHFRTIGGAGGVFMDAVTGMPNPDAVASSSASREQKDSKPAKQKIVLKDGFAEDESETPKIAAWWGTPEDILKREKAIDEIKRDRKYNRDLDEVFAALDSDGELDSTGSELGERSAADALEDVLFEGVESASDLLADDFVAVADEDPEVQDPTGDKQLEGIVEEYREPRLLDEQFEKFMRVFEPDSTDEDDDYRAELLNKVEDVDDYRPHLTSAELQCLWEDEGLANDLSGLQIDVKEETDAMDGDAGDLEHAAESERGLDASTRVKEFNEYTAAEFERGMKGVIDSYTRISANVALGAIDGADVARQALARAEEEEKSRLDTRNELGLDDSDGHDSELDSHFDEMFKDKGEHWDCETILSTYSNLENHPSVIDAPAGSKRRPVRAQPIIRLDPRTQAPAEFMHGSSGAGPSNQPLDYGSQREPAVKNVRVRGETKEEKKARKTAVREAARERRALKSEMRKAFGAENVKQGKHATALGTSKVAIQF